MLIGNYGLCLAGERRDQYLRIDNHESLRDDKPIQQSLLSCFYHHYYWLLEWMYRLTS
jgi:hypothetical protein